MRISILIIVAGIVVCSSCNQPRYIYSQSARNLHFFEEKGEAKLAASLSTGPSEGFDESYNTGHDLQAAYALTNRVALMASYYYRNEKDRIPAPGMAVSEVTYRRTGWEAGVSWFVPVDQSGGSYFHVDLGYGSGSDRFTDRGTFDSLALTRNFQDQTRRLFIQPGLYAGSDQIKFGVGVRMQWVAFRDIETDYRPAELEAYNLGGLQTFLRWSLMCLSVTYRQACLGWDSSSKVLWLQ